MCEFMVIYNHVEMSVVYKEQITVIDGFMMILQ